MPTAIIYWAATLSTKLNGPQCRNTPAMLSNCQGAYTSSHCSWLFALASSKNHESQAKTLKSTRHRFFSPPPLFAVSLGSAQCSGWDRGYLRLWHCHLASGSTCVPEVLILILNRLDTKTNKLSSLQRTGQKNYGHGEGCAITAANLQSPKLCPLSVPPQPPLILNIGGAQRVCIHVWLDEGLKRSARRSFPPSQL